MPNHEACQGCAKECAAAHRRAATRQSASLRAVDNSDDGVHLRVPVTAKSELIPLEVAACAVVWDYLHCEGAAHRRMVETSLQVKVPIPLRMHSYTTQSCPASSRASGP